MKTVKELKERHKRAKAQLNNYQDVLEDAYRYCNPDKNYFSTLTNGRREVTVYDSTAITGVGTYADKLQQNLVPPWRKWAMLIAGSEIPEEYHQEIQPQLDKITDIIYDHLNHSNFNIKVNEMFQDVAISTGVLVCQESDSPESSLMFDSIPIEHVALEESPTGIVENVYMTKKIKVAKIESLIKGAKLTQSLKEKMSKDENVEVDIIECVIKEGLKYYHYVYYEPDEAMLFKQENDTSPFIVVRERVNSNGCVYGLGRGISYLPDIKVLNKIVEYELKQVGFNIAGVYTAVDDGVLNPYTVRFEPGTIIPVQQQGSLQPLAPAGNFQLSQVKIEQYREHIERAFLANALGSITKTPVRTATEISERTNIAYELSASINSRMQTEFLERLLKRVIDVLAKAGKIQPIKVDGKEVTIKFTSPLAKIQDREDNNVIIEYAQTMAATGIPMQELGRSIKFEEIPRYVAENMGVESKLLRTDEERNVYDVQQAQAQMAAMQAQGGQDEQV